MRTFTVRNSALGALLALLLLPLPASAVPLLTWSTSSIALSPTTTDITFDVDPNGTPLAGVTLYLSALATGLEIVSIQSSDAEIATSGPALNSGNYEASFVGGFLVDRSGPFTVGTVTVEGFTPGTPLVLLGTSYYLDAGFSVIPIPQQDVATVATPEPTSAALLSLGILVLAGLRRGHGATQPRLRS